MDVFKEFSLGLKLGMRREGLVRNLVNGRVEAVFEGEQEAVKELIEFCKHGPPGARVAKVDVKWEAYTGEFYDFEIRY